jgi:DNA-directed RNA polymerase specialized sigma24 family protein
MSEKLTYTIAEIAQFLGVSTDTVKAQNRTNKGFIRLRKRKRLYSKTEYLAILEIFGISKRNLNSFKKQ